MDITKYLTTTNYTKATNRSIKYIVLHYTANNGDTAMNNAKYFYDTYRGASAHYFVDENEVVQVVDDSNTAWHCGTTGTYYHVCRNSTSIGIEMCSRQYSNGTYYIKEEVQEKTMLLVHYLMNKHNIPIENVIRHYDVTRKTCPAPMATTSAWNTFYNKMKEGIEMYTALETKITELTSKVTELTGKNTLLTNNLSTLSNQHSTLNNTCYTQGVALGTLTTEYETLLNKYNALTKTYATVDDMPSWYKEEILAKIDRGSLKGDLNGNLNLTEEATRILVITERDMGLINEKD